MESSAANDRKKLGAPHKAPESRVTKCRYSFGVPEGRVDELLREVGRRGMPISTFAREAVLLRLDEIRREESKDG